jgi:hypothetical protein
VNLQKLADFLEVKPEDLAPSIIASTTEKERPAMAMSMVAGHAHLVFLELRKLLPLEVASEFISLISRHEQQKKAPPF